MALIDDPEIKAAAGKVSSALKADVILYNGEISTGADLLLRKRSRSRKKKPNVFLIIVTRGGDAGTAYKLASPDYS